MSPVRVTLRRTVGRLRSLYSTAFIACAFFAAAAAFFAFNLEAAEGGRLSLATVWTMSVAPLLPVVAALFGMDVWSEERFSGRLDILLASPVRESDFVVGKFLGVWMLTLLVTGLFHLVSMIFLSVYAPRLIADLPFWGFLPGFLILALQSATWSAVAVLASAMSRRGSVAATMTILFLVGLPRGAWWARMSWSREGRLAFGEMPFDAQVCDFASGLISLPMTLIYILVTVASLFLAAKLILAMRYRGVRAKVGRFATLLIFLLTLATLISGATALQRFDLTIDVPVGLAGKSALSARTQGVLAETRGEILISVFLSRKDLHFRSIAHFLRTVARESEAQGGARIVVRYVDPNWDLGAAERLVRLGAKPGSVVFERGYRMESMSLTDGFDERVCVYILHRISLPPQRRTVYWTTGHRESSFSAYDAFGMSTIARELARAGYRNCLLDLTQEKQVPDDCALVIVAGAKYDFSRVEAGRLEVYLKQGGRLLVLLSLANSGGVAPMLSRWGIRPSEATYTNVRTLSGTDVIVSDFSSHPITGPLTGSQIVLEKPITFAASAAVETGGGADRIEFLPLARVGDLCVAAVSERGAGTGEDLKLRPTRIVAVGDVSFVMNGPLSSRANANRDFFLNCVAYLAGTDGETQSGEEEYRLISRLDRRTRRHLVVGSVVVFPLSMLVVLLGLVWMRRRRG